MQDRAQVAHLDDAVGEVPDPPLGNAELSKEFLVATFHLERSRYERCSKIGFGNLKQTFLAPVRLTGNHLHHQIAICRSDLLSCRSHQTSSRQLLPPAAVSTLTSDGRVVHTSVVAGFSRILVAEGHPPTTGCISIPCNHTQKFYRRFMKNSNTI